MPARAEETRSGPRESAEHFSGERRRSGRREPRRKRRGEGSGACGDEVEEARAELYRAFAGRLAERTGLTPVLWDERRTTIEAHSILSASGKKMKQHKKNVDAVAATLILEGYLTRKRMG